MTGGAAPGGAAPGGAAAELEAIVRRVAEQAGRGEAVEAYARRAEETFVRAYRGAVERLESATAAGIGVRVVTGGRQGFSWAGTLEQEVIDDVLAQARDNARFATPDEHVVLAEPDGIPPAALDLWHDALLEMPASGKADLALELERRVLSADRRIRVVEQANFADVSSLSAIASSTGISASTRRTSCYVSCYAIAGDDGDAHTGGGYSAGRAPGQLDMDKAVRDAVERSTRLIGARKPASGEVTVVLEPQVTAQILAILSTPLSGEQLAKGRSFFSGRVGEEVATPAFGLVEDPTDTRAFAASPFDGEGLACRRTVLVEDGYLAGFLHSTESARRCDASSTGSAVRSGYASTPVAGARALQLVPGTLPPAEIVAAVTHGVLVQSITGVHSGVNPVSGDFSVGIEGLAIHDGAIAEPLREATIASTLQRMLRNVVAVGDDVDWLPGIAAGVTLAIGGMSMSGT